jgi:glycosyltransferase involved in cell wall biosynthesis
MNVSVLVPAHNEASNIQTVLASLLAQKTVHAKLMEIVVIASGCTDNTAELARAVAHGKPGMHVHVQERRAGKVAAINEYLKVRDPRADVIVICSADLRVHPDVIERIVECFRQHPEVGMVGARPMPDNDTSRLVGKMVNVMWEMHHRIAELHPKMGELVSFRGSLIERVSELSVVDEASIEDVVRSKGYELAYVGDAVVTNHGPDKWSEYFEQRRRIARGHYWLDFAFGYQVATLDKALLVRTALDVAKEEGTFGKAAIVAAAATEIGARLAGFFDARVLGGKHRTWKQLRTTKTLRAVTESIERVSHPPTPPAAPSSPRPIGKDGKEARR